MTPNNQQEVQVKMTDEVMRGQYANLAQISHTQEEFIFDFINVVPPTGIVTSRVFVSPEHAKRIAKALLDNVEKYEAQFGKIQDGSAQQSQIGFRTE